MKPLTVKKIARAYLLSILAWGADSLLTGWGYYELFNRHSTLRQMVILAEARGISFALLTPPIFYLVRRFGAGAKHSWRYWAANCIGIVPFVLLYACIRWLILPPWDATQLIYLPRSTHGPFEIIRGDFAAQITMYVAIVLAAHAYGYFDRVRRQELERAEFQRALAVSELQALKMQLQPHFLFNTLHGISTLIKSDPDRAVGMLVKLSSLLRKTILHTDSDLILLRDEIKFVEEYLDLEKMRLGPRLTVNLGIDPETLPLLVPPLVLQPLVENAIRHGIGSSRERGWVEITSRRENGSCEVRIQNSTGTKRPEGTGVGLRNTVSRLKHVYSNEASFSFLIGEDRIATATLVLPALGVQQEPARPTK